MAVKGSLLLFLLIFISALSFAHPSWVQSGVTAVYDGYSGVKNAQGGYDTPASVKITNTVDSVNSGVITTTSSYQEVSTGMIVASQSQTFQPADTFGAFWADPATINGLSQGEKFGVFTVVGKGPVTINNKQWNAIMFNYEEGEVRLTYTFELSTGLLISMTEIHGKQEVYGYYNSINVDLSKYQYTGTGGAIATNAPTGGIPGWSGTSGTGTQSPGSSGMCGSLFLLLSLVAISSAVFRGNFF